MADEIRKQTGVDSELIASGGGVFEVSVDGKKIFSKRATGRFPDEGEVLGQLRG